MKTNEETAVLTLLRRQAPQSFEELMALSGLEHHRRCCWWLIG